MDEKEAGDGQSFKKVFIKSVATIILGPSDRSEIPTVCISSLGVERSGLVCCLVYKVHFPLTIVIDNRTNIWISGL